MPDSPSSRSKTTVTVATALAVTLPAAVTVSTGFPSPAAVPVATLQQTMAAVVAAVESLDRRDSAPARPVDFQFQVGHESLSLRLELKAGTIQATFHTNSAELRHALAHEWQAVMPDTVASGLGVAQPVFGPLPSSGTDTASGSFAQGGSQDRGHSEPERATNFRRADLAPASRPVTAPAENSPPPALSLLNTFA